MDFKQGKKTGGISFHHQRTEKPDAGEFDRHCHPRYELLYLLRGRGKFVVESVEYPLREGMAVLLRPYEYHYVQPDADCIYERIVVNFTPESIDEAVRALPLMQKNDGSAGVCFFPDGMHYGAAEPLRSLDAAMQLDEKTAALLLSAVLHQVLPLLHLSVPAASAEADPLMERVMSYLTEHLAEELSLEELANRFFLSKYHLCRTFRKHAGVTVLDYLTAKRVAMAQTLLAQGVSAAEAARQTGFAEYSTFYRAYRKHTGKSPARQRK